MACEYRLHLGLGRQVGMAMKICANTEGEVSLCAEIDPSSDVGYDVDVSPGGATTQAFHVMGHCLEEGDRLVVESHAQELPLDFYDSGRGYLEATVERLDECTVQIRVLDEGSDETRRLISFKVDIPLHSVDHLLPLERIDSLATMCWTRYVAEMFADEVFGVDAEEEQLLYDSDPSGGEYEDIDEQLIGAKMGSRIKKAASKTKKSGRAKVPTRVRGIKAKSAVSSRAGAAKAAIARKARSAKSSVANKARSAKSSAVGKVKSAKASAIGKAKSAKASAIGKAKSARSSVGRKASGLRSSAKAKINAIRGKSKMNPALDKNKFPALKAPKFTPPSKPLPKPPGKPGGPKAPSKPLPKVPAAKPKASTSSSSKKKKDAGKKKKSSRSRKDGGGGGGSSGGGGGGQQQGSSSGGGGGSGNGSGGGGGGGGGAGDYQGGGQATDGAALGAGAGAAAMVPPSQPLYGGGPYYPQQQQPQYGINPSPSASPYPYPMQQQQQQTTVVIPPPIPSQYVIPSSGAVINPDQGVLSSAPALKFEPTYILEHEKQDEPADEEEEEEGDGDGDEEEEEEGDDDEDREEDEDGDEGEDTGDTTTTTSSSSTRINDWIGGGGGEGLHERGSMVGIAVETCEIHLGRKIGPEHRGYLEKRMSGVDPGDRHGSVDAFVDWMIEDVFDS